METPDNEFQLLRAEVAALRQEVAAIRSGTSAEGGSAIVTATDSDPTASVLPGEGPHASDGGDDGSSPPASGRRRFLRLAAGGAAAAGAATVTVALTGTEYAAASTGSSMLIGSPNLPTAIADVTSLINPNTVTLMPITLRVNNFTSGSITLPAQRIAVAGTTSGPDSGGGSRVGVYGRIAGGDGAGVFGGSNGSDELPFTGLPVGVCGTSKDGIGVAGHNTGSGIGVAGESLNGVSLSAGVGGRIRQTVRTTVGPPASGAFSRGEQIRDLEGDLYLCMTDGNPGVWQKVAAGAPGFQNASGSVNLLSKPIRLVDTRGNGAPITNGGNRLTPSVTLSCQITGNVVGGISVPAGAVGVLANLTMTSALAEGWAAVWPSGPFPGTSNMNYSVGTSNPAIANFCMSGLDGSGKLLLMAVSAVHAILDVFGFVF